MALLLCSINYIIKNNENMANNAYFTSRSEIIEWINDLVITNLTKIQQLGSGNIYCQLLDAAFPHHVALNKVKWHAYLQVDFLHNFKILQTSFQQLGINKIFDAQKLAKAKYQDNLQFVQWFKWQFGIRIKQNGVYNALARRSNQKINLLFTNTKNFDLRQTMTKSKELKESKENKQNIEKQSTKTKMVKSQKQYSNEQHLLKTNRTVLGVKLINSYSKEEEKGMKSAKSTRKLNVSSFCEKENVKMLSTFNGNADSKLKKKKLTVVSKPVAVQPKNIKLKAVEVIQSDEQECF